MIWPVPDNPPSQTTRSEILQWFSYDHLPTRLQVVSKTFGDVAELLEQLLPPGAEKAVALRKLLEGKDAAVRSYKSLIDSGETSDPSPVLGVGYSMGQDNAAGLRGVIAHLSKLDADGNLPHPSCACGAVVVDLEKGNWNDITVPKFGTTRHRLDGPCYLISQTDPGVTE